MCKQTVREDGKFVHIYTRGRAQRRRWWNQGDIGVKLSSRRTGTAILITQENEEDSK